MKRINIKIEVVIGLALAAAILALNFLPVRMTVFENPQDPALTPLGEILPAAPLIRCASDISNFGRYGEIGVSFLFATYNRLNTGHYTMRVFVPDGYNSYLLHEEIFSAADIADNKYRSFAATPASSMPGPLCFSLSTADSAPGNAITLWLNSEKKPVMKITAVTRLPDLMARLATGGYFGIGPVALFGLFFACLFVQFWLIIHLAVTACGLADFDPGLNERNKQRSEKISKPAHRK